MRPVLSPNVNAVLAFAPTLSPHHPTPVELEEECLLPLQSSRAPLLALRLPFLSEIRPADLAADVTRLALPGLFSPAAERALIGATLFTTHLMLFYHSSIFRIDLPSGTILVVT